MTTTQQEQWAPDIRTARAAARKIPEAERGHYRAVYYGNGKFDAMYCMHCMWEYGKGHYYRDCPLYVREV